MRSTSAGGTGPGVVTAAHETRDPLADGERRRLGDRRPVLGVCAQVVTEGGRAAEHREHPLPGRPGGGQRLRDRGAQRRLAPDRLHEPHQTEQGAVGVGHLGQGRGEALGLDVLAGRG